MNDPSDAELVRRCRAGDKAAFSILVARHEPHLRRLLYSVLRHGPDVEDIVQESLLQAFLGIHSLRDAQRFRSWLFGIGLNLARLHRRALSRQHVADGAPLPERVDGLISRPPEQSLQQAERAARLRAALADIPPSEREALLLVYSEGLSHRAAAEALGASPGAIKVRVHRGRRRLREALSTEFGPRRPTGPEVRLSSHEEVHMIPVTIHDVLESESLIDHRPVLSPLLAELSPPTREQLLNDLTIHVDSRRPFAWQLFHSPAPSGEYPEADRPLLADLGHRLLPHFVVLLKETDGPRALPIWIGPAESGAIVAYLQSVPFLRPILPDLLASILTLGNIQVERATVSRLHDQVFYGTLQVRLGDEVVEVDCRPSDAISLAIRVNAPLFVAGEVMDEAGVLPAAGDHYPVSRDPDSSNGWRSLLQNKM